MANFNEIGTEIVKEGIFERFPNLKPYVGEDYWSNESHSQLLVIGESNYFDLEDAKISCFQDADEWYVNAPEGSLIPTEELKKKVGNDGKITAKQLSGLYHTLTKVLNRKRYSDVAYYNFFLRPAFSDGQSNGFGKKGYYQEKDGKVAFSAFCGILDEIKPNIVIFATKLGYDKMEEFKKKTGTDFGKIVIKRVAHPSSKWWNVYGKHDFENLLIEHWLEEKPAYYLNFEKLQNIHAILKQKFNVEKEPECFTMSDKYLSCLYFQINNYSFCCETNIAINGKSFWSGFYPTNNCQIPALVFENTVYEFLPTDKDEVIVAEIEKRIQQVINELSK